MAEKGNVINLRLDDYKQKGLYLILQDSSRLILTRENIERLSEKYWEDPVKIPPKVKEAPEFQRCSICPLGESRGFCNGLGPILPFLEVVDKYVSFDKVKAVYRGDEKELFYVSDTTMQQALKYVCILSLTHYCEAGKKYLKYFLGTIPLMQSREIASRLYMNIYLLQEGQENAIHNLISKFKKEIQILATSDQ